MDTGERGKLVAFVDAYVVSFEAWDILMYFAAHPDGRVDATDLARDIGRRVEELAAAAQELERLGVLAGAEAGGWRLVDTPEIRGGLRLFAEAVKDQKDRLFVLTRLLENLSR
ncbi:MAG: hypothetical protein M1325_00530 [Actinobacteria bacterium]|nr:hypothetical protein [Actinomycetota bacterium]